MKWFEHQTSACQNKKIRKIEVFYKEKGGQAVMAAVGRFWRLHEIVGSQGIGDDNLDTYALPDDYGMEVLADDLFCSQEELLEFLELLAEINSIDPAAWRDHHRVYLPKLAERADTYTKRRNIIRTDNKECSNSLRTVCEECSPPQAQAQVQAQIKSKKRLATPPPNGNGSAPTPSVFSCKSFEVTQEHLTELIKSFPQFPASYLCQEFFPRMADWCLDHVADVKHRKKFDAAGRLKSPRACIRNWLKNEDGSRAEAYRPRPKPPPPLPAAPPGQQWVYAPDCSVCRGSGRDRDKPCACGRLEDIVDPDPQCPKCQGRGITKNGVCDCLTPRGHGTKKEPSAEPTLKPAPGQ